MVYGAMNYTSRRVHGSPELNLLLAANE